MQTPGNYYVRERDREREESSEEGDGDLFRALTLYLKYIQMVEPIACKDFQDKFRYAASLPRLLSSPSFSFYLLLLLQLMNNNYYPSLRLLNVHASFQSTGTNLLSLPLPHQIIYIFCYIFNLFIHHPSVSTYISGHQQNKLNC